MEGSRVRPTVGVKTFLCRAHVPFATRTCEQVVHAAHFSLGFGPGHSLTLAPASLVPSLQGLRHIFYAIDRVASR
jgi:hypothetical protein